MTTDDELLDAVDKLRSNLGFQVFGVEVAMLHAVCRDAADSIDGAVPPFVVSWSLRRAMRSISS